MKTCVKTRRVTGRNGYEIVYVESSPGKPQKKPKVCWISTWMEWAREARVYIGSLKVSPDGDPRIVRDPGDIFAMSKEEARKLLAGLEMEGTMKQYVQEHCPKYIDADGEVMKFTLAIDLGLIEA